MKTSLNEMSTNTQLGCDFDSTLDPCKDECDSLRLPSIVRIVLTQAARLRRRGEITEEMFAKHVRRLEREELKPRGLVLQMRNLSSGSIRFLVGAKTAGTVCDLIECGVD